jgi:hypothetical protein
VTSDYQQNLTVLTEHILRLADKQNTALGQLTGANRAIVDPARQVMNTHGLACGATNLAVEAAEKARRAAGAALVKVSTELAEKLTAAANNYDGTDSAQAGDIGACGV